MFLDTTAHVYVHLKAMASGLRQQNALLTCEPCAFTFTTIEQILLHPESVPEVNSHGGQDPLREGACISTVCGQRTACTAAGADETCRPTKHSSAH